MSCRRAYYSYMVYNFTSYLLFLHCKQKDWFQIFDYFIINNWIISSSHSYALVIHSLDLYFCVAIIIHCSLFFTLNIQNNKGHFWTIYNILLGSKKEKKKEEMSNIIATIKLNYFQITLNCYIWFPKVFLFIFYWRMIDIQYSIDFNYTTQWFNS